MKRIAFTVNVFLLRNKNIHVKFYIIGIASAVIIAILIWECCRNLIKKCRYICVSFWLCNSINISFVCRLGNDSFSVIQGSHFRVGLSQ